MAELLGLWPLGGRSLDDPWANTKAAAHWVRGLPTADMFASQQRLVQLLQDFANRQLEPDETRLHSLLLIDLELGYLTPMFNADYLKHCEDIRGVEPKLWHALDDICRWFAYCYEMFFHAATSGASAGKMNEKAAAKLAQRLPDIIARLLFFKATQAKLRLYRFERWIPANWRLVHRLYETAKRQNVAGHIPDRFLPNPEESTLTIEEQFIGLTMMQLLTAGNLSAPQIHQASVWLATWVKGLNLSAEQPEPPCFALDLAATDGLQRLEGRSSSPSLLYLDTRSLQRELTDTANRVREFREKAEVPAERHRCDDDLALLQKLAVEWSAKRAVVHRRGEREPLTMSVSVARTFGEVCKALHYKSTDAAPARTVFTYDDMTDMHIYGFVSERTIQRQGRADNSAPAPLLPTQELAQAKDQSDTGMGLKVKNDAQRRTALGMLFACKDDTQRRWTIGVVRRVKKVSTDVSEVGLQLLSRQPALVKLTGIAAYDPNVTIGFAKVPLKIDPVEAIYLPPSDEAPRLPVKTLIVPKNEYKTGRSMTMAAGKSSYTIRLKQAIESGADWVWAGFDVLEKHSA